MRKFSVPRPGDVELRFGFSDELELFVDDRLVFSGSNTYSPGPSRRERGYIELGANSLTVPVAGGRHTLGALVKQTEPFGWGLALALSGEGVELLPVSET